METKKEKYKLLLAQIRALVDGETNTIGVLANVAAALHESMHFWWTGFYLVHGDELQLGPFQGPVACMSIKKGHGVCGTAWAEKRSIVVPDVEKFPGHIACSAASRSEIVVPLQKDGIVCGVLDIDSEHLNYFDDIDREYLEQVAALLEL